MTFFVAFKAPRPAAKYTLNINKENKKFSPSSNRVKKPRTPNRVVVGSKGEFTNVCGKTSSKVKFLSMSRLSSEVSKNSRSFLSRGTRKR